MRMSYLLLIAAFITVALGFSIGNPPTCTISADYGCDQHFQDNRLNCTEATPGIMPWALRPVVSNAYRIRPEGATTAGPYPYTPGELMVLELDVLEYDMKVRGLLAYGAQNVGNGETKVGNFEFPESDALYMAPFASDHPCFAVALHASARLKPFHSLLYWRAPAAGTGDVTMRALVKRGDANTGEWYYVPEITLTEGTTASQNVFKGDLGQSCDQVCQAAPLGQRFSPAMQQGLEGEAAFSAEVDRHYSCARPLMTSCEESDPSTSWDDWCAYRETTCAGESTATATSMDDKSGERFCACEPDPCEPNPCDGSSQVPGTYTALAPRGVCIPLVESPMTENSYICDCFNQTNGDPEFAGARCETILVNPCDSTNPPCAPGTCVKGTGQLDYSCSCPECRYASDECSVPAPCDDPMACNGHGTCAHNVLSATECSYTCQCDPGWRGEFCDELDDCYRGVGQNLGDCGVGTATCEDITAGALPGHFCSCMVGPTGQQAWRGQHCDIDINECQEASNYGITPDCSCTNTNGGFTCSCVTSQNPETQCFGALCDCCTIDCQQCENLGYCDGAIVNTPDGRPDTNGFCPCTCPPGTVQVAGDTQCRPVPACQSIVGYDGVEVFGPGTTCPVNTVCEAASNTAGFECPCAPDFVEQSSFEGCRERIEATCSSPEDCGACSADTLCTNGVCEYLPCTLGGFDCPATYECRATQIGMETVNMCCSAGRTGGTDDQSSDDSSTLGALAVLLAVLF